LFALVYFTVYFTVLLFEKSRFGNEQRGGASILPTYSKIKKERGNS
jgi:hypothetical protein